MSSFIRRVRIIIYITPKKTVISEMWIYSTILSYISIKKDSFFPHLGVRMFHSLPESTRTVEFSKFEINVWNGIQSSNRQVTRTSNSSFVNVAGSDHVSVCE